eukprot:2174880-Pyramimonas_sp.AAC.1
MLSWPPCGRVVNSDLLGGPRCLGHGCVEEIHGRGGRHPEKPSPVQDQQPTNVSSPNGSDTLRRATTSTRLHPQCTNSAGQGQLEGAGKGERGNLREMGD